MQPMTDISFRQSALRTIELERDAVSLLLDRIDQSFGRVVILGGNDVD